MGKWAMGVGVVAWGVERSEPGVGVALMGRVRDGIGEGVLFPGGRVADGEANKGGIVGSIETIPPLTPKIPRHIHPITAITAQETHTR